MSVVESVEEDNQTDHADGAVTIEKGIYTTKADGSANNSLENMESLMLNEDEDDDPIGCESLRLSGSEGEERDNISPVYRKKRLAKILDSDEEDDQRNDKSGEKYIAESKDDAGKSEHVPFKPKKFSALIDSDSEREEENSKGLTTPIDSDSAGQTESKKDEKKKRTKASRNTKQTKEIAKLKSGRAKPVYSDIDDTTEATIEEPNKNKERPKMSNLIDSDTESSVASDDENEEFQGQEQEKKDSTTKRPKKQQRASAKKAMDEMQAIQSESQRLHRETHISIPYHKPKRHTLKEFLTRRTILKPQINKGGSGKKLKMSYEELEVYAKHLDERAKEATEFFKSESEEELKDNVQDDDENEKIQQEDALKALQAEEPAPPSVDDIDKLVNSQVTSEPTIQELIDLEMSQDCEFLEHPIASTSTAAIERESQREPTTPTSKLSALKCRLLAAEKDLPLIPTLKGDPHMMIDFETGDIVPPKPTGIESLFQRFIKSNVNNKKPKESALAAETISDITKIDVSAIDEPNKEKEPKPGAAYIKLKESLRTLITNKRKEDFKKKLEETQEEELEYNKCCGLEDDDNEEEEEEAKERKRRSKKNDTDIVIDDEENEIELPNDEEDDEEVDDLTENGEEVGAEDVANDKDDNGEDEFGDDEDEDSESESDDSDTEDPNTRKHRVIKAFVDSDDEKDELDIGLNTSLSTSVLFAEEKEKNPEEVESELLGLCSGQFEDSQRAPLISQIPITQTPGNVEDTELMDLCSGVFNEEATQNSTHPSQEKPKTAMKIISSEEENEEQGQESINQPANYTHKIKKLKKKKKKRANLVFSDEDDEEEPTNQDLPYANEGEEEEDIPQTFIDYDSEENEIEVQMSKKECLKEANTFLEKEAELSESEWGSADEDEQNLDKYDIELGDEDEFDGEKIQAELGQIHMRKVLDDDIREVKKIQEMLFDDEEVDGVGRQRQFRWKNIESSFSLDDPAGGGGADNDDGIDSADDEEEMKWRKMRFEREQLLKQKTKEEILAEVSATALGRSLLSTMEPDIKSDIVYEKEVFVAKEYKAPSFLIAQCDVKSLRGSFLNYDKDTLARIAVAAEKSGIQTDDDQLQNKASKTGNFVFAPLSEEEKALRKRKSEEAHNLKTGNVAKKLKPNMGKSLLLDKLL